MKRLFRYTYLLMFAAVTAVMAACSSDEDAANSEQRADGKVPVRLHLRVAGQNNTSSFNTRATWSDENATDDEMMNVWAVVAVYTEDNPETTDFDEENKVAFFHASIPEADNREIDDLVYMTPGKYKFYSFANINPTWLNKEGITCYLKGANVIYTDGSLSPAFVFPINFFDIAQSPNLPDPGSKTSTGVYNIICEDPNYPFGVSEDYSVQIDGNGFDPTAFDPENNLDNGFDSKGIPMSNVQEITITSESDVDLIVVRMMAKMKISVTNATGSDQYIKYATISNVTSNESSNLKLLPMWTSETGKDDMTVVQHGDLQPNLDGTPTTEELHIPGLVTTEALANNATREITFYINECAKGTDFYLTIGLGDDTSTQEYRYALIDNRGASSADNDKWDYIARNDYRIIPVTLDNYKLELVPYDFPPIGVYPVSVSEIDTENHIYNFTFHDYGHFHLVPKVTNTSTLARVEYNTGSGDYWTLNPDWAGTLKTAATKGGAWLDAAGVVANGFYRNQTATVDGDEAGGVPVFYANTSSPQWDPAGGTSYRPFVFGYIAEPPAEWWTASPRTDRQIYHEFRVKLYVGGEYRRDLTYRYYMTLDAEQMLGSRSLRRNHIIN